jgi:hypothetical protein
MAALSAQSIQPPQVGFASGAGGSLRRLYGVAGNFILGSALRENVLSQAFSGSLGLLKTATALQAFDAQGRILATLDAAPGPALIAFTPGGLSALVYLPGSDALIQWQDNRFETLPVRPAPDNVVALAFPDVFEASLFVQRGDTIWELRLSLRRPGPLSQRALPGVTAPLLALANGSLLFSDPNGLVLRRPDNSELHLATSLPAGFSLQQMSGDWIQLSDRNSARRWAVRISPGREAVYQLPEASQ